MLRNKGTPLSTASRRAFFILFLCFSLFLSFVFHSFYSLAWFSQCDDNLVVQSSHRRDEIKDGRSEDLQRGRSSTWILPVAQTYAVLTPFLSDSFSAFPFCSCHFCTPCFCLLRPFSRLHFFCHSASVTANIETCRL